MQTPRLAFVAASALTLVHQAARQVTDKAPRADILGMRALAKIIRKVDTQSPPDDQLYPLALVFIYFVIAAKDSRAAW